jgi:hypothetical protein
MFLNVLCPLADDTTSLAKGLIHRSAPIESVAMSKQGLTVMFSKCPAT